MADEVLQKFGRYFLLDRIAQGGMAEIYRARLATPDGGGRLLVIKRIQSAYGQQEEFIEMFRSEIKVMMGFNHPSIVQLYDFGEEQNQPFIAMEYVDGKSLKDIISRFNKANESFPIDLAVYVTEQTASALNYAHTFRDKITGEPLNLVHRDVSPQNILISFDGNIKIIDFGIAKVQFNAETTKTGVIKGKPSYLSPEQVAGKKLDGRSDIFSLGIVLWELLTGRKLFAAPGENEFAVLKQIESCQSHVQPPSRINPEIPRELDYIVLKALAKNPEKRYPTAEAFQRSLHRFLYSYFTEFNPADLTHWAKSLFKDDIVQDRKRLQNLNAQAEKLLASDIPEKPSVEGGDAEQEGSNETGTFFHQKPKEQDAAHEGKEAQGAAHEGQDEEEITEPGKGRLTPPPTEKAQSSSGSDLSKSEEKSQSKGGHPPRKDKEESPQRQEKKTASASTPPSKKKSKNKNKKRSLVPVMLAAAIVAILYWPKQNQKQGTQNEGKTGSSPPPSEKEPRTSGAQKDENSIRLRLNIQPSGGGISIRLNGEKLDSKNPVARVPLDEPLELDLRRERFKPLHREFVLESEEMEGLDEWSMDVQLEPLRYGFLSVHTTPSAEARIEPIDDKHRSLAQDTEPWVLQTPVEDRKMPVGKYRIHLKNTVLGMEKTITRTIQEGQSTQINTRLTVE